jgi:hypothetical protein
MTYHADFADLPCFFSSSSRLATTKSRRRRRPPLPRTDGSAPVMSGGSVRTAMCCSRAGSRKPIVVTVRWSCRAKLKCCSTITRVGHDARRFARSLSEGGNEPKRNERKFVMARTSTTTATTEPKTPAFQAWHVTNKGDDSFWTKVGAVWPHRDGKGLSLITNRGASIAPQIWHLLKLRFS